MHSRVVLSQRWLLLLLVATLLIMKPNYEMRTEAFGGDDFRIGRTQLSGKENVTIDETARNGGTVCFNILYDTSYHAYERARNFFPDNVVEFAYKYTVDPIVILVSPNHYQATLTRSLQKMYPKFAMVSERQTFKFFAFSDPGYAGFTSCVRFDFNYGYRNSDEINGLTIPAGMSLDWLSIERELFPGSLARIARIPANGNYIGFACGATSFKKTFQNPVLFYTLFPPNIWQQKRDFFDVAWVESITSDSFYACIESPPVFLNIERPPYKLNYFVFDNSSVTQEMRSNGLQFGSQLMRWNYGSNVKIICVDTPFPKPYTYTPHIFANVNTRSKNISEIGRVNQALIGWVHFISSTGFRFCVSEAFFADRNLLSEFSPSFDWMAVLPDAFLTTDVQRRRLGIDMMFQCRTDLGHYQHIIDNYFTAQHILQTDYIMDLLALRNGNTSRFTIDLRRIRHVTSLLLGVIPFYSFRLDETSSNDPNEMKALDIAKMIDQRFSGGRDEIWDTRFNTPAENQLNKLINPFGQHWFANLRYEWGRSCVSSPFGKPTGCSVDRCGGDGGTVTLTRQIISPAQGIARKSCPQSPLLFACNREPCISSQQWTTWSLDGPVGIFSITSGAGIGIIVAVIAVLIAVVGFAYYVIRQKRSKKDTIGEVIGKSIISA